MKNISPERRRRQRRLALLLPSSLRRCQTAAIRELQQQEPPPRCSGLSVGTLPPFPACLPLSLSLAPVVSFYDQPLLFSAPQTDHQPPLPPHPRLIDLSWVSGGKYKSSHCHFKQRDNQTLGCPLTTQGNWPWL